jgi:hypothetical protein
MALLSQLIPARELASLNEHQLDVLTAALDSEILSNAAVKRAVASKVQGLHRSLAGGSASTAGAARASKKRGGGGSTGG